MSTSEEKRGSQRVELRTEVDLESASNFFTGFSTNVSEGGLFVASAHLLPIGTGVDLRFSLPESPDLRARGVVRWIREVQGPQPWAEPGMGVQFQDLDAEVERAIVAFVGQREPLFYPDA